MQAETRAVCLRVSLIVAVAALLGAAAITTYLVSIGGLPASAWLIWFGMIAGSIAAGCVLACGVVLAVMAGFSALLRPRLVLVATCPHCGSPDLERRHDVPQTDRTSVLFVPVAKSGYACRTCRIEFQRPEVAPMAKRWSAVYEGHEIVVENHWFYGCKLYVDGECRDTNKEALAWSGTKPRLTATIEDDGGESHTVVVFAKRPLFGGVKIKICVDGKQIGGDAF